MATISSISAARKRKGSRGFHPLNVFATRESGILERNGSWLAEPANAKLIADQIAPGFTPDSRFDLANFGGKTVTDLVVQAFYVSSKDKTWAASDSNSIDTAMGKAFADWRLNSVVGQYFSQPITTTFKPSSTIENDQDKYEQTDVEDLVKAQYTNGNFAGDFGNTLFCLMLAPGIELLDSSGDDSFSGLGGYHGSVDIARTSGTGTDRVYYAAGVYSQAISSTVTNGINVFSDSWKNVVATFYHEINEMRTDADVELATSTTSSLLGWYSTDFGEIGDIPITEAGTDLTEVILEVNLADGGGTVPVQLLYSNMDHGPSLGLNNGDLLREANGAIWVVFGGARFHVPDVPTLERLYGGTPIIQVATGGVNWLSQVPVDGTLLREENGAIWVVFGGAIFHVPDPPTLARLYGGRPIGQLWDGGPEALSTIPVDSTLLREENGAIWVVFGGAIFHVPDPPTLARLYGGKPIGQLWDGGPEALSTIPVDGALLREENGAIWVIFGGARFHVPDPPTLARLYGGRPIGQLWDGGPEALSTIPVDGTLLREENGAIWVVFGGAIFHVPDPPTLARLYGGKPIGQLWDGGPEALSTIPFDGTLLREENGAIWVIFGGARFHVPDPPTLARLYGDRPIDQLWDGGPEILGTIPADGTLLREESSTQVYVIQGGSKVAIQPPYPGTVYVVWDGALEQIPG
jgi:hypothetical protein